MIEPLLRSQLERDEKLCLEAYKDTNGFWTIGIGHLLGTEPRMTKITKREAYALLAVDVEDAEKLVEEVFGRTHSVLRESPRGRALINMAFNRGGNMKTSTTITPAIKLAMETNDWKPVTVAIEASEWAKQVKGRANRIAQQLEEGVDV